MVSRSETLGGSLEDLRAYCAVVEQGSISAAARHLETTKGGLSRQVSRLERRLGATLLARTPRAVTPTEEGTAFYEKARDALVLLDEAASGASQAQSDPRGHLRVTAPLDFGVDVLPPLIVEFRRQYPQITLDLLISDTTLDLAALRIDLALRATRSDLPDMGYRASTVIEFPIALYAAPGYLEQSGMPARPADLAAHAIVMSRRTSDAEPLELTSLRGRKETLPLRPVLQTNDFSSANHLLIAGGGIGALPEIIAAPAIRTGRLQRVLPDWIVARARMHAITIAGRDAPARVRAFRDFVREKLQAECPA